MRKSTNARPASKYFFASQLSNNFSHPFVIAVLGILACCASATHANIITPGEMGVTPAGAATYTVPIQVPPGTAGMAPSLSLNYNSQASNGLMGVGWSLGGLSSITRCPQTVAQDGVPLGITRTNTDRFCLDGQRLMTAITTGGTTAGAYGAHLTEYRTEIESFSKIISYSDPFGPYAFKVYTKSGIEMNYTAIDYTAQVTSYVTQNFFFGTVPNVPVITTNSKPARYWVLNSAKDTKGNYYKITYEVNNTGAAEVIPRTIEYTGNINTGLLPYNRIDFLYGLRSDIFSGYMADGSAVGQSKRLTNIVTYADTKMVRDYRINYDVGIGTKRSRLVGIQECVPDPAGGILSKCLRDLSLGAQTSFAYTGSLAGINSLPAFNVTTSSLPATISADANGVTINQLMKDFDAYPGDYNGDGVSDLLLVGKVATAAQSTALFCKGPGITNSNNCISVNLSFMWPGGTQCYTFSLSGIQVTQCPQVAAGPQGVALPKYKLAVGDFDGDGITDLYFIGSYNTRTTATESYYSGSFFCSGKTIASGTGTCGNMEVGQIWTGFNPVVGNYQGTGKSGIYFMGSGGGRHCTAGVDAAGTTDLSKVAVCTTNHGGDWSIYSPVPADFNGDGITDLILGGASTSYFCSGKTLTIANGASCTPIPLGGIYGSKIQSGDFNGDGIADVLVYGQGMAKYCPGPNIITSNNCIQLFTSFGASSSNTAHVGDFDGDGISDVMIFIDGSGEMYCKGPLVAYGCELRSISSFNVNGFKGYPGDYNGDGTTDLYIIGQLDGGTGTFGGGATGKSDLLSLAYNGLNTGTSFSYKPLTDNSVYTKGGTGSDYTSIQVPMYVVSQTSTDNPGGGYYQMDYSYYAAWVNTKGRGFTGFSKQTIEDRQSGIKTDNFYSITYPTAGMLAAKMQYTIPNIAVGNFEQVLPSQILLRSFSFTYAQNPLASPGQPAGSTRYFVAMSKSVENAVANGARDFPNSYGYSDVLPETTISYDLYDTYGNATQITNTNKHPITGQTFTKVTTNTYDNFPTEWILGRLRRATVASTYPGTAAGPTATATRVSAFAYDTAGAVKTGLLTQEVIEPDSTNTAIKLTTDYLYDAYGNKTSTKVSGAETVTTSANYFAPRTSTTVFDARGQFPKTSTNALLQSETMVYDARFGTKKSLTGPNGLTTTWAYDNFGNITNETRADGTSTDYFRSVPLLVDYAYLEGSITTGSPTQFKNFDRLGREVLSAVRDFDGAYNYYVKTIYDNLGRVQWKTNKYTVERPSSVNPQWTYFAYDSLGRLLRTSKPDGSSSYNVYMGLTSATINSLGAWKITQKRPNGEVMAVSDSISGADINSSGLKSNVGYYYDPFGNLLKTQDDKLNSTLMAYDIRGRKTSMTDPSMGAWIYTYNALGELKSQKDAKLQTTNMTYDALGRMTLRSEVGLNSYWSYDGAEAICGTTGKTIGKQQKAWTDTGYVRTPCYDTLGRPTSETISYGGVASTSRVGFDSSGRLATLFYPSGLVVKYGYNTAGYLFELRNVSAGATPGGDVLWNTTGYDINAHSEAEGFGNNIVTKRYFSSTTGRPTTTFTGNTNCAVAPSLTDCNVQFSVTSFNSVGNLIWRNDALANAAENISYDQLNRVTSTFSSPAPKTYEYDSVGNISYKSDVGYYTYNAAKPYAVASVSSTLGGAATSSYLYDTNGNMTSGAGRSTTWTSFNMPDTITVGAKSNKFWYGPDHDRIRKTGPEGTTDYLVAKTTGAYSEKLTRSNGTYEYYDYLTAGGRTIGVHVKPSTGIESFRYFHTDHLGSIVAITGANGAVLERFSYDPFGKRRNINGTDDAGSYQAGNNISSAQPHRGYTGHETLEEMGIVHMNGRLYDPRLGRVMSADPIVQAQYMSQSYNRYSYCMNNPLLLTDPSGYSAWTDFRDDFLKPALAIVVAIYAPEIATFLLPAGSALAGSVVVQGAIAGFIGGAITSGTLEGAFFGGITGAAFGAMHLAPSATGVDKAAGILFHGAIGGMASAMQGGDFRSGFFAAAFTKGASVAGIFGPPDGNRIINAIMAGIVGGTASVIGGGKFANGAVTGAMSRLLNDQWAKEQSLEKTRSRIASMAISYVGNENYMQSSEIDNFGEGKDKCNKFLYDVATKAGADVPQNKSFISGNMWPPVANDWENKSTTIQGWAVVKTPEPGDVAAFAGHVGIVSAEGLTVSARQFDTVVQNNWGFRAGQTPTFRRYVGN
jgi:RHS repeat-associated protein